MQEPKITLTAARVNAGMTQSQVASELGVNKTTLINWEKGRTSIPAVILVQLCKMYNFPVDNIFLPGEST